MPLGRLNGRGVSFQNESTKDKINMFSSTPSVIFSKAGLKPRASFTGHLPQHENEVHEAAPVVPEMNRGNKLSNEDRLRLVQLEIAQREACKVLRSTCDETSKQYGVSVGTDMEINDFLTGILMLGNLCKRIGNIKLELEKEIESYKNKITKMDESRQEDVSPPIFS
jgi:hypothetical protein